jgi:hypothetical protein
MLISLFAVKPGASSILPTGWNGVKPPDECSRQIGARLTL